jgi:hypothetical protein
VRTAYRERVFLADRPFRALAPLPAEGTRCPHAWLARMGKPLNRLHLMTSEPPCPHSCQSALELCRFRAGPRED